MNVFTMKMGLGLGHVMGIYDYAKCEIHINRCTGASRRLTAFKKYIIHGNDTSSQPTYGRKRQGEKNRVET